MINKIVIDGNDGTGKSFRIEYLKKMFPNIMIKDRGIFSEYTLNNNIFNCIDNITSIQLKKYEETKFFELIEKDNTTLYIICDCSIEKCQERISNRGDSLDEEYHTKDDLNKYKKRFLYLYNIVKGLHNVILINTEENI